MHKILFAAVLLDTFVSLPLNIETIQVYMSFQPCLKKKTVEPNCISQDLSATFIGKNIRPMLVYNNHFITSAKITK